MVTSDDFTNDARKRMVDSQIRPNKVTDPRILAAMRTLPRHRFLPGSLQAQAYSDQNVHLGGGRVMVQPMVLARLLQAAEPVTGETVLVVGTGYTAAVLANLGCAVTLLEESEALAQVTREALSNTAPSVTVVAGSLTGFWPSGAPYDLIVIEGAVAELPAVAGTRLKRDGGRLIGILGGGRTSQAVRAEPTSAGLSSRALFDCVCPVLPAFAAAPAFAF